MTKKDFKFIADVIIDMENDVSQFKTMIAFADALEKHLPNFSRKKFISYIEKGVKEKLPTFDLKDSKVEEIDVADYDGGEFYK